MGVMRRDALPDAGAASWVECHRRGSNRLHAPVARRAGSPALTSFPHTRQSRVTDLADNESGETQARLDRTPLDPSQNNNAADELRTTRGARSDGRKPSVNSDLLT